MTTVGKIYRLPEELGGAQVTRLLAGPVGLDNGILVELEGVGPIVLALDLLVEVPPPIPDEPEPGAYNIGDVLCVRDGSVAEARWYYCKPDGRSGYMRWVDVWARVGGPDIKPVPLVPAPALPTVDPEAPWTHTDGDGDRIVIRMVGGATGAILTTDSNGTVILDTHEARVGAALYILAIDKAIEAGS